MSDTGLKIAVIQIPSLPIEKAKLDYFLMIAKSKKALVAVLPEYTTNLFFKELEIASMGLIEEQSTKQNENLQKLSTIYNIIIIAPMVIFKDKKPYKTISIYKNGEVKNYFQHILMPYKHWNEKGFFNNNSNHYKPVTIMVNGFKIAVMAGFETHFDGIWQKVMEKKVDVVITPSASTFETSKRWQEIFKTRAFTNSVYILRANRIGEYHESKSDTKWIFYGNSFVVNPFGEIDDSIRDQEEILITELYKKELVEARKLWQFQKLGALI